MNKACFLLLPLLLIGCSWLDLDDGEKAFDFKFFWSDKPSVGEEDPENPGFDTDGNKIPSAEVLMTYTFPDIHAGTAFILGDDNKITPTINVELFEFRLPYLRWSSVQVGAGADEYHFYVGKRFTSILEVTVGPMLARRLDENSWEFGIQATLIKF